MSSSSPFDSHFEISDANNTSYEYHRMRLEEKTNKVFAQTLVGIISVFLALFSVIEIYVNTKRDHSPDSSLANEIEKLSIEGALMGGLLVFAGLMTAAGTYLVKNTWFHEAKIHSTFGILSGRFTCCAAIALAGVGIIGMTMLGYELSSRDIGSVVGDSIRHGSDTQNATYQEICEIYRSYLDRVSKSAPIAVVPKVTTNLVTDTTNIEINHKRHNADASCHSVIYDIQGTNTTSSQADETVTSI